MSSASAFALLACLAILFHNSQANLSYSTTYSGVRRQLKARATATSRATSGGISQNDLVEAIASAYAEAEGNGTAASEAVAEEAGIAFAEAWAAAEGHVLVEGQGFAVSHAKASSKAIAKVVAIAVSQGVSRATGGHNLAVAEVEVEELAAAIVTAAADASVQVSTTKGSASAQQKSVAIAVAKVVARAVAGATAVSSENASFAHSTAETDIFIDEKNDDARAIGNTAAFGRSDATATGNANANFARVRVCTGAAAKCCSINEESCGRFGREMPRYSKRIGNANIELVDMVSDRICVC